MPERIPLSCVLVSSSHSRSAISSTAGTLRTIGGSYSNSAKQLEPLRRQADRLEAGRLAAERHLELPGAEC
jgi:hypothetical protein